MYECLTQVQQFVHSLKIVADLNEDVIFKYEFKIWFEQSGAVESFHEMTARLSDDLTKVVREYSYGTGRSSHRIHQKHCVQDYATPHRSKQLYMNRLVYIDKVSKVHTNNINSIYKHERDEWKKIKTNEDIKKHPAIQTLLWIHRRERATQTRALKRKPIGFGSHDFRRKQKNILNGEEWFAQVPVARTGVIIRTNDYMIEMNSIILTRTPGDTDVGFFCSNSMVHAKSCSKWYLSSNIF